VYKLASVIISALASIWVIRSQSRLEKQAFQETYKFRLIWSNFGGKEGIYRLQSRLEKQAFQDD